MHPASAGQWSLVPPIAVEPAVVRPGVPSHLRDARLYTLWAPSGAGKTVAAARLARTQPRVGWLSLTNADRTLTRFLSALSRALRDLVPSAAAVVSSTAGGSIYLAERLANALRGDGQPLTVVIDDMHMVDDLADIRLFMNALLAEPIPSLTLVLVAGLLPRLDYTPVPSTIWRNAGTTDFLISGDQVESVSRAMGFMPTLGASDLDAYSAGRLLDIALLSRYAEAVKKLSRQAGIDAVRQAVCSAIWDDVPQGARVRLRELARLRYADPSNAALRWLPAALKLHRARPDGASCVELHVAFRQFIMDRQDR